MNQETKSESSPALEVREDGQIWLWPDLPMEPKLCFHIKPENKTHHCDHSYNVICECNELKTSYRQALASAERLLVSNQEDAYKILAETNKVPMTLLGKLKPGIYHTPELKLEVIEKYCNRDDCWLQEKCMGKPCMTHKAVIISLPESEKESQEELWAEAHKICQRGPASPIPDLMKMFNITRRKP